MKWRMPMTKTLTIHENIENGIIAFLKLLLEKNKVVGVFSLKKINAQGDVAYSLITNPDELKDAVPFYPLMPVNAGKLLSRFTLKGNSKKPVIAVVKPCELRGFVELLKRQQGSNENLYIISSTCGGVYPSKLSLDEKVEKKVTLYWNTITKGDIPSDIRPICKSCTEFFPYTADFIVDLVENKDMDKIFSLFVQSKKGEELTKDINIKTTEKKIDQKKVVKYLEKRESEKEKIFTDINEKMNGIDGLIEIFGRCIGCHGCSKVCPVCYCTLCEFDSSDSEYEPSNYNTELKRRGGIRVPPGILYYHLGRLTHIGISCVGCGSCEDVCPVDIPIAVIFKKVGESVQKMFNYVPGKDVEEEIPLVTFEKEEFDEIEK
jgi:formate dehydrogenase subunit beta